MSTKVLQPLTVYRPFGQPAYATIQVKTVPNNGDTVTIDGTVFTYGTDFSGQGPTARIAQGLTAAIRSDVEISYLNSTKQPVRTFTAEYYNDTVFLYCTFPGTSGNSMTLATSNSSAFNISGATFANGTNGTGATIEVTVESIAPMRGPLTDRSGTITTGGTAQNLAAANASRNYFFFQNQSSHDMYIDFGATAAIGTAIKVIAGASLEYADNFVPNTTISVYGGTTSDVFVAKEG